VALTRRVTAANQSPAGDSNEPIERSQQQQQQQWTAQQQPNDTNTEREPTAESMDTEPLHYEEPLSFQTTETYHSSPLFSPQDNGHEKKKE
jgi:hypothetical protein